MKKHILTLSALIMASTSALACPDLNGKYLCPEEALSSDMIGSRSIQIAKSPIIDTMYRYTVGQDAFIFELDSWNPLMDPASGEVDPTVQIMGACDERSLTITSKTEVFDEHLIGKDVLTKTDKGVQVTSILEDMEMYSFECVKQ